MCGGQPGGSVRAVKRMQNFWTNARGMSPSAIDGIVAAALVVGAVAMAAGGKHHGPLTLLTGAVCCATVAWRRTAPTLAVTVVAVGIVVFAISSGNKNLT